jgi:HK97 family phage major capsid protein
MTPEELKKLNGDLQSAVAVLQKTNDEHEKFVKHHNTESAEMKEKLGKANTDITALQKQITDGLTEIKSAMSRSNLDGDIDLKDGDFQIVKHGRLVKSMLRLTAEEKEYVKSYRDFFRKGKDIDPEIAKKSMYTSDDPNGGVFVAPDQSGRVIQRVFETSALRSVASVQTVTTDALEGLVDDDEASAGWAAERGARSETNTAKFGQWRIPVHEQYAVIRISQRLLDDAKVDLEALIQRKVGDKFARIESAAFINGNGTGKPRGILTYPTTGANGVANTPRGSIEQIASGVAGEIGVADGSGNRPADALIKMQMALKEPYRSRAKWLMGRAGQEKCRLLKMDGKYVWTPMGLGGLNGQMPTLFGYDIVECNDMQAWADNSLSIAFGDWAEAYQIVDRQGVRVLRDPYTVKPYVEFYFTKRVGGDVLNFEALKLLLAH